MFKPAYLDSIYKKRSFFGFIKNAVYRIGGGVEVLALIAVWIFIFKDRTALGGLTLEDTLIYILIGNLIGSAAEHLLRRIVVHDISQDNFSLLMNAPLSYLKKILVAGFGRSIFPFILSIAVHISLLYFFLDGLKINSDPRYLIVIFAMIVLAFLFELLILYFFNFFVFWSIAAAAPYSFILRIKNFLAGNYFPLSIFPAIVSFSLAMPFAYSCFVPAELYLKKIDLSVGLRGLGVQLIWIIILYVAIKIVWNRKKHQRKIETRELFINKGH